MPLHVSTRLPSHVADAFEADLAAQGITRTELMNAIVEQHYFGGSPLVGADAGYLHARRTAVQLAQHMIRRGLHSAIAELPEDYDSAITVLRADKRERRDTPA